MPGPTTTNYARLARVSVYAANIAAAKPAQYTRDYNTLLRAHEVLARILTGKRRAF